MSVRNLLTVNGADVASTGRMTVRGSPGSTSGAGSGVTETDLVRLTELPAGSPVAVVVRQLTEHVQGDVDLITRLKEAGVVPNARVTVEADAADGVTIVMPGHADVSLPYEMAHAVKVQKV